MAKNTLHLVVLWLLLSVGGSFAQELPDARQPGDVRKAIRVGLYVSPPFVMQENGHFTGMAVELWQALADAQGLQSKYETFPTVRALIDAAASNEIDVAVTNLTITQGRAQRIDFTYPWFDAGLRIMIGERQGTGFLEVLTGLRDSGFLRAYAWITFVVLAATVMLTLFDRRFDPNFPRRWREGVAESFFAVMSIAVGKASGRKNTLGWIGRVWQGLWLVCGIAVLAFVTSSVTSVMTTLSLTNQINSLTDLPGKAVGVFAGSVSEEFARNSGLEVYPFPNIDEAVAALHDGDIVAIVGDAPVLEFYAHRHPEQRVDVIGGIFEPDKYGFGLPLNSPSTRRLTVELIGAHERGLVEQLHDKYFGTSP